MQLLPVTWQEKFNKFVYGEKTTCAIPEEMLDAHKCPFANETTGEKSEGVTSAGDNNKKMD